MSKNRDKHIKQKKRYKMAKNCLVVLMLFIGVGCAVQFGSVHEIDAAEISKEKNLMKKTNSQDSTLVSIETVESSQEESIPSKLETIENNQDEGVSETTGISQDSSLPTAESTTNKEVARRSTNNNESQNNMEKMQEKHVVNYPDSAAISHINRKAPAYAVDKRVDKYGKKTVKLKNWESYRDRFEMEMKGYKYLSIQPDHSGVKKKGKIVVGGKSRIDRVKTAQLWCIQEAMSDPNNSIFSKVQFTGGTSFGNELTKFAAGQAASWYIVRGQRNDINLDPAIRELVQAAKRWADDNPIPEDYEIIKVTYNGGRCDEELIPLIVKSGDGTEIPN